MKCDDRTVAGISLHIIIYVITIEPFGVVAGHKVPHHHTVVVLHPPIDRVAEPTVRRTEVGRRYQGLCFRDIDGIGERPMLERAKMVKRVIAHLMASANDFVKQCRVLSHVVTHHKESGLGIKRVERIQDERRCLGDGTIVESEINSTFLRTHPPQGVGIE